MSYILRLNVHHDGHSLPKGSECPAQFVKPLLEQGLLIEVAEVVEAAPELEVEVYTHHKKKKKVQ